MAKRILITGFKGGDNSSKVLLDKINHKHKLYLENDFRVSEDQIKKETDENEYDEIIMFGQKPLVKKIYIELLARDGTRIIDTSYDFNQIIEHLNENGYKTLNALDAGKWLCNNVYFFHMDLFKDIKVIFVHIPTLNNIEDIDDMAKVFSEYLKARNKKSSSEYLKDLRRIVGKRPLLNCKCDCLVFDKRGQVLLQRRSDDGLWGVPGGSMELGETTQETVKRKMLEETGLEVDAVELFNVYSGEEQRHIYPNGDQVYPVVIMFKTTKYKGNLRGNKETEELKFFDIEDMPGDITRPFVGVLKDLKDIAKERK